MVSSLTFLWDIGTTNITIKRKHTKHYERRMRYNKVEFSTAAGAYCTTHKPKLPFCMPYFSNSKIIQHRFHVDNNKRKSGIGYDMIIDRDLMVKLGLLTESKRQFLQWDGLTVTMKEPIGLLGKSYITIQKMCEVIIQTA